MNIENIWQEYQVALRRFLHSKLNNRADVDDVMQDIFIKTHQNIHTIKDISKLRSWLFQLANNTVIDFYRAKRPSLNVTDSPLPSLEQNDEVQQDLVNCLAPFIQALPPEQGELLQAVDLNNEGQKALAEKLNIGYSTLKSRIQTSRKALRGIFDECCHFDMDCNGRPIDYHSKSKTNDK